MSFWLVVRKANWVIVKALEMNNQQVALCAWTLDCHATQKNLEFCGSLVPFSCRFGQWRNSKRCPGCCRTSSLRFPEIVDIVGWAQEPFCAIYSWCFARTTCFHSWYKTIGFSEPRPYLHTGQDFYVQRSKSGMLLRGFVLLQQTAEWTLDIKSSWYKQNYVGSAILQCSLIHDIASCIMQRTPLWNWWWMKSTIQNL